MADKKVYSIKEGVSVTEEVIGIISGLAATEVKGVSSLAGNLTHDVVPKAGKNKIGKAVHVVSNDDESINIRLAVNIEYNFVIPEVCKNVQDKVKTGVENMTGLNVREVDIHIATVAGTNK